ncbi:MAG: hypothetical protein BWY93_01696 [Euryarchaeota archaeon ADurb.BinA087]|nr:MAG: hypothetical protein BWY93_01696 [Euryarchaeota archaeon ADurb.BinA087]
MQEDISIHFHQNGVTIPCPTGISPDMRHPFRYRISGVDQLIKRVQMVFSKWAVLPGNPPLFPPVRYYGHPIPHIERVVLEGSISVHDHPSASMILDIGCWSVFWSISSQSTWNSEGT